MSNKLMRVVTSVDEATYYLEGDDEEEAFLVFGPRITITHGVFIPNDANNQEETS
jgi:hypothetical protein